MASVGDLVRFGRLAVSTYAFTWCLISPHSAKKTVVS